MVPLRFPVPVFIVAALMFRPTGAPSQWVQSMGPEGAIILSSLADSAMVFVGTEGGGIYRSSDNGDSWMGVNNGLTWPHIWSLLRHENFVFASSTGAGVFRSVDNGSTWSESGLSGMVVTTLASSGSWLFAGTYGNGLFRSSDDGINWIASSSGLTNNSVSSLAFNGDTVFIGTRGGGVFRSTNRGETWNQVNAGLTNLYVFSLLLNEHLLLAGTQTGIFMTANSGDSWSLSGPPAALSLASAEGYVFAATYGGGVYRSNDGGLTWTTMNTGLENLLLITITATVDSPSGLSLFVGADLRGSVSRSTDLGSTWASVNEGLVGSTVAEFALLPDDTILAGTSHMGVFLSTDGGLAWEPMNEGLPSLEVSDINLVDTLLFVATSAGLFNSADLGGHWAPTSLTSAASDVEGSSTNLFVATRFDGIFRSTDYGTTWVPTESLPGIPSVLGVLDSIVFAGTLNGFFKSTNNGTTWVAANSGLGNLAIQDLVIDGTNLLVATEGGVFLSTTLGDGWVSLSSGLLHSHVFGIDVRDDVMAAATFGGGVYLSADYGGNWESAGMGPLVPDVLTVFFTDSLLFAGTWGSGVWRRPLSNIASMGEEAFLGPDEFSLSQNYPNPFNGQTVIGFQIRDNGLVVLQIVDLLGREIATIVKEKLAPGAYRRQWDATGLPSGVYFYRLQAGGSVATRKLVLLK